MLKYIIFIDLYKIEYMCLCYQCYNVRTNILGKILADTVTSLYFVYNLCDKNTSQTICLLVELYKC